MHTLDLTFSPLCAERMALREWDTFFFGTANTMEGKNSSSEFHEGKARVNGDKSAAGRRNAQVGTCRCTTLDNEKILVRKGLSARDMVLLEGERIYTD